MSIKQTHGRDPPVISDYQTLWYDGVMRTITATEASRNFKKLLDAVESGERVAITRGGETVAEMSPRKTHTAKDLFDALDKLPPIEPEEADDIEKAIDESKKFVHDDLEGRAWFGD